MGGYAEAAAATYVAVQGKEDAHHQEQMAKSQMRQALNNAPPVPNAPDTSARDRLRQRQRQNAYGRQDTILTGSIGAPTDASGARRTLLGA